jgi:ketosteroid isomerase-like protein
MSAEQDAAFDFDAYRRALVTKDVPAWLGWYAEDAEWIEYNHRHPPRAPRRLAGKQQIAAFLAEVAASDELLEVQDEVVGPQRVAFCIWCTLPDGRRIVEHAILHLRGGRIARHVEVEAWD